MHHSVSVCVIKIIDCTILSHHSTLPSHQQPAAGKIIYMYHTTSLLMNLCQLVWLDLCMVILIRPLNLLPTLRVLAAKSLLIQKGRGLNYIEHIFAQQTELPNLAFKKAILHMKTPQHMCALIHNNVDIINYVILLLISSLALL